MKKIIPNITFKSLLSDCKSIEEKNKMFNTLSNEGQRLEIAWDALNMVTKGLVQASSGCYWSEDLKDVAGESKELQEELNKSSFFKKNNCEVCQRGLLMLSQIRLGNSIGSRDCSRDNGASHNIKGFDIFAFNLMEDEYESSTYNLPHRSNTNEKLANICCNILVNGEFNTADDTDYLIIK